MNSEELKEIQKMIREGIALGLKDVEMRSYIGHRTHLDYVNGNSNGTGTNKSQTRLASSESL